MIAAVMWVAAVMTSSCGRCAESQAKRLYDDKLEKSTYKKLIRPVDNASESLTVRIGLRLTSIIDVVSDIKSNQIKFICSNITHNIGSSKSVHEQGQQGWKQH